MKHGGVWWAELSNPWGRRPVVLLARDEAYSVLSWMMVVPASASMRRLPTTVQLDPDHAPVLRPCVLVLDHVKSVRTESITDYVGELSAARMREIDRALHVALGLRN